MKLDAPYTWDEFNNLPYEIRDGVLAFWEPGYDYLDDDFWARFDPVPAEDFKKAVIMYDWLMKQQENSGEE